MPGPWWLLIIVAAVCWVPLIAARAVAWYLHRKELERFKGRRT